MIILPYLLVVDLVIVIKNNCLFHRFFSAKRFQINKLILFFLLVIYDVLVLSYVSVTYWVIKDIYLKTAPLRTRTKRLQKKLKTEDFQELCYPIRGTVIDEMTDDAFLDLADRMFEFVGAMTKESWCHVGICGQDLDLHVIVRVNTITDGDVIRDVAKALVDFDGVEDLKIYAPVDNNYSLAWDAATYEETDNILLAGGIIN